MPYIQYTHCVSRGDWDALNWKSFIGPAMVALGGIVAAFAIGPVAVFVVAISLMWAMNKVCSFLLGGKLICLARDQCVIGRVVQLEPVGWQKEGFEKIDNDYSVNLLVAPHLPTATADLIENDGSQGTRMKQKIPETDGLDWSGYTTNQYAGVHIPVLHCEFEGSRIKDFCDAVPAALAALAVAAALCFIPIIGWIACLIILAVGAAIAGAILLSAWFGAHDGDPHDAEVNPGDGDLNAMDLSGAGGDYVVITGDWVYDSGHSGWNEFHPAKSVQKLSGAPYWLEGDDEPSVEAFRPVLDRWCGEIGTASSPLVVEEQRKDENRWVYHPAVDGCSSGGDQGDDVIK